MATTTRLLNLHQQLIDGFQIPMATANDKRLVFAQKRQLQPDRSAVGESITPNIEQANRIAQIALHSEDKYSSQVSNIFDNLTPKIVSLKSQLREYREVCPKACRALELLFAPTGFMGDSSKTNEFSSGVFNSLTLVKFADEALACLGKDLNDYEEFKKMILGVKDLHYSFSSTPNPYSNMFFEEFILDPMRPSYKGNLAAPEFYEFTELPHKYSIRAKASTMKTFKNVFAEAESKSKPWDGERKLAPNASRADSQQFQYDYNFYNIRTTIGDGLNLFGCPAQFATVRLKLNKKPHDYCTINIPEALYMLAVDIYSFYSFGKRVFG